MPQERLDEATIGRILAYTHNAQHELEIALGLQSQGKHLSREVLETITADQLALAQSFITEAHFAFSDDFQIQHAIARSVREAATKPPPPNRDELVAQARAYFKSGDGRGPDNIFRAGKFMGEHESDIRRLALSPAECSDLARIACGHATHLSPPPPPPPSAPLSPEELQEKIAANLAEERERVEALREGIRQGRGLGGPAAKPEAVVK